MSSAEEPAARKAGMGRQTCWFLTGSVNLGHPQKIASGRQGEDALFESPFAVGVADGVSGWADSGVDAGEYSRALMARAEAACDVGTVLGAARNADKNLAVPRQPGPPFNVRDIAHVAATGLELQGSSTMTLAAAGKGLTCGLYNLGDSGWLQLRLGGGNLFGGDWGRHRAAEWGVVARSKPQNHYFNCPYQVGAGCPDHPGMGDVEEAAAVLPGDLLLLTTDGLFDNLYDHHIINAARRVDFEPCLRAAEAAAAGHLTPEGPSKQAPAAVAVLRDSCKSTLASLAGLLATESQRLGNEITHKSPFSATAARHGYAFDGGKLDDVAVVLALVLPPPRSDSNTAQ